MIFIAFVPSLLTSKESGVTWCTNIFLGPLIVRDYSLMFACTRVPLEGRALLLIIQKVFVNSYTNFVLRLSPRGRREVENKDQLCAAVLCRSIYTQENIYRLFTETFTNFVLLFTVLIIENIAGDASAKQNDSIWFILVVRASKMFIFNLDT